MCTGHQVSTALTTSARWVPMGKKAAQGLRPTLQVGRSERAGEDGFTLLETVCVLAIVAMLAAVVLPAIPRGTSRAGLEAYALETATLLQTDRNAAIRRHQQVATAVDAVGRSVRSGATGRIVRLPDDGALQCDLTGALQSAAGLLHHQLLRLGHVVR